MSLFTSPVVRPPVPTGIKLSNPADLEALRAQTIEEQSALLVSFAGARVLVDAGRLHWLDWVPVAALGGTWLGPVEFDAEGRPYIDTNMVPITHGHNDYVVGIRDTTVEDLKIRRPSHFEANMRLEVSGDAVSSAATFAHLMLTQDDDLGLPLRYPGAGLGWTASGAVRWRFGINAGTGPSSASIQMTEVPNSEYSLNGRNIRMQLSIGTALDTRGAVAIDDFGSKEYAGPQNFSSVVANWALPVNLMLSSRADLTPHRLTLNSVRWIEAPLWAVTNDPT